jgi:hypothetical protein
MIPAPSSCLRKASTASIVGSTTALLLSKSSQISLRMTRWSSRSTTFRRSFVHHVRGPYSADSPGRPCGVSAAGLWFAHALSELRHAPSRHREDVCRTRRSRGPCTYHCPRSRTTYTTSSRSDRFIRRVDVAATVRVCRARGPSPSGQ